MSTKQTFCTRCNRPVTLVETLMPGHLGHANLQDPETVCLDCGPQCSGERCAVTGQSQLVMAVRLARSGLRESIPPRVRVLCSGCGEMRELEVLDLDHGYCPVCGSTISWVAETSPASD